MAEEADIAARVLPGGFGSLFLEFSSNGNVQLVALLKDLSVADDAKRDLQSLLACDGAYPGWAAQLLKGSVEHVVARQAQYTGTELLAYAKSLEPLRSDPAVWAVEVDPEANRVWIGLIDGTQHARVQQGVIARGVPLGATLVEMPAPATGTEPFAVLNSPVATGNVSDPLGTFFFSIRVRYSNRQASTRYPDWCVDPDPDQFTTYFLHTIEKWDGSQWREVKRPICQLVLLAPRPVDPGGTATDSVPVAASRSVNIMPYWRTARITGTYRFVGKVYLSMSATPPFVANLAPLDEQVSAPFRLVNTLPF